MTTELIHLGLTMKLAPVKHDSTPDESAQDFIHGKDYIHSTGDVVCFDNTSWCISPVRGKWVTVNFSDLPEWLVRPAKVTTAQGWLTEGASVSALLQRMSAFRQLAKWLRDFKGISIAELSYDHETILQTHLAGALTQYNDTLEKASLKIGRELSFRESKRVSTEAKLLGPKSISNCVSTFNAAARLIEEVDGLAVSIRLQNPRAVNNAESHRMIGSADPNKVLAPEQIAELERALGRDLQRYKKARALIDRELDGLDFNNIEKKRPDPIFDLERYFGLNGFREHTSQEIATLRGLSPNGGVNVVQLIKRFLSKKLGTVLADELMRLRSQFRLLRGQKRSDELSAAREYILSVLATADLSFQEPKAFCLERYFGVHGFRVHSAPAISKQLGVKSKDSIFYYVHEGLFSLVGENKGKRLLAVRHRLRYYLTRAIKAQVLRLQIGVARRISAVLEIPIKPKMRIRMLEARRVVEIQFRAGKTWGDEGLKEWVPCVDKFGEIAEDAIRTAQMLTKDLRLVSPETTREKLFIIPDNSFENVVPLSEKVFHEYIFTNQKGKDGGILRRWALDGLLDFETHHLRHTHATHMIEEGGTIHDVAHYLGHTTFNGSTTMAGVFYLAGGTERMRQQTAKALRNGAATGLQFDGIARMKTEAMDEQAKSAPVPPNQLSFEQARQRVLSGDILDEVPVDSAEAVKLMNQKVVFNVTLHGGCILQASGGHCPTANPCPIGIVAIGEQPLLGCGCKYLVLLPHSADQLAADLNVMEAQLNEMSGEEWAGWKVHIQAKMNHWGVLLETAKSLNKLM
jgi:hypothetical protein